MVPRGKLRLQEREGGNGTLWIHDYGEGNENEEWISATRTEMGAGMRAGTGTRTEKKVKGERDPREPTTCLLLKDWYCRTKTREMV